MLKNLKNKLKWTLVNLVFLGLISCGVKGDPLPPEKPAELGRGKPTYKRATEEFAFPELPPVRSGKDTDDYPEDDESEEGSQ